jgi:hypothetical protein
VIDPSKFVVINRSNYRRYKGTAGGIHPGEDFVEWMKGSTGYQGWQDPAAPHVFRGPKPVANIIPRSEWADRIKAGQGSKVYDAMVKAGVKSKDQNGLNYCWCYGSVRAVEARKVFLGVPHVELSPESVGGPVTGWRNVGGYASQAFDQIQSAGICEVSFMPSGADDHSLRPNQWKSGWQENAKKHETIDWYNLDGSDNNDMFSEVVTCLLNDCPVAAGLGWWGHLVAFIGVVLLPDGTVGVLMQNSWLQGDWPRKGDNGYAILTEAMGTPDGAAAPIVMVDAPIDPPSPVDPTPVVPPFPQPNPLLAPAPVAGPVHDASAAIIESANQFTAAAKEATTILQEVQAVLKQFLSNGRTVKSHVPPLPPKKHVKEKFID